MEWNKVGLKNCCRLRALGKMFSLAKHDAQHLCLLFLGTVASVDFIWGTTQGNHSYTIVWVKSTLPLLYRWALISQSKWIYRWPLNNMRVRHSTPCVVENQSITLTPQYLTTNHPLLARSLLRTQSVTYFACHMYYMLYSYHKAS